MTYNLTVVYGTVMSCYWHGGWWTLETPRGAYTAFFSPWDS